MKPLPSMVSVRVPASTANLGPGFDALGLAVAIYNTVTVTPSKGLSVEISGEGASELPRDATNAIVRAMALACAEAGHELPSVTLRCTHDVPTSRGLGSSSTALVAGLLLGDALCDNALGRDRVFALAAREEGHPDNVAPAIYGGLQVCAVADDGRPVRVGVPVRDFPQIALFIPDMPMPTKQARAVLPASLSRADVVFTLSRAALVVGALAAGDDDALAEATRDLLHQKPREVIFPAMPTLFAAAREAGALAAWLSGAGSTIAAFVRNEPRAHEVCEAMRKAAESLGVRGRTRVASVDTQGAVLTRVG